MATDNRCKNGQPGSNRTYVLTHHNDSFTSQSDTNLLHLLGLNIVRQDHDDLGVFIEVLVGRGEVVDLFRGKHAMREMGKVRNLRTDTARQSGLTSLQTFMYKIFLSRSQSSQTKLQAYYRHLKKEV